MAADLALVPGVQADDDMGVPRVRGEDGMLVGFEWKSVRILNELQCNFVSNPTTETIIQDL